MEPVEYLYRFDAYNRIDVGGAAGCDVVCQELPIVKRTPRGVWVKDPRGRKNHFILNRGRKRYAYPTASRALDSYKSRKEGQRFILNRELQRNRIAFDIIYNPDWLYRVVRVQ